MKPVAVDAMGGDYGPEQVVAGGLKAVREFGIPVMVAGPPDELQKIEGIHDVEIIEAHQVIPMDAEPGISVRRMRDSSISRAAEAVRNGRASAMVSPGNTGAVMGTAILRLGRIPGIPRPAVATRVPTYGGLPTTMLDCGANAECKPEWLVHFARMGVIYARDRFNIECPRVGLLSIGEEEGKGNPFVKEAYELLNDQRWTHDVHAEWVGNVEGNNIMSTDVDVVVTDGFTGNITLKVLEGTFRELIRRFAKAIDDAKTGKATDSAVDGVVDGLTQELHPDNVGGALLLGVKGVCVISHGSSSSEAIMNAIVFAHEMATAGMIGHLSGIGRTSK
ncbi:MAG: phosphate acyltransferase PlsX [Acidimicrobiaceae bacterium]|nr:phosphate acyltransferase PlsX [Acidimicrobiaceae bacterium]